MDSRTRVEAALSLGRPDRPPTAWRGHTYPEEWSPADLAAVTVARQRMYGWDSVKLQPRACCFAEAFGCNFRPSGNARTGPVLLRPGVSSPEDWSRLPAAGAGTPPTRWKLCAWSPPSSAGVSLRGAPGTLAGKYPVRIGVGRGVADRSRL